MPWTSNNPIRTVALEIKLELLFWLNGIACILEADGEDGDRDRSIEGEGVRGGGARERRSRKRIQSQNGGNNISTINHR